VRVPPCCRDLDVAGTVVARYAFATADETAWHTTTAMVIKSALGAASDAYGSVDE
jgi:hypothetical protein